MVDVGTPGAVLYDKVMPHRFEAESDDRLVNSAIANYALEGNTGGKPNGNFYVTKGDMKSMAKEVVGTHLGLKGGARDSYVNERFPDLWNTHDVLRKGFLNADEAPVVLKSLVGNVELNNGLQLQMKGESGHHQFDN